MSSGLILYLIWGINGMFCCSSLCKHADYDRMYAVKVYNILRLRNRIVLILSSEQCKWVTWRYTAGFQRKYRGGFWKYSQFEWWVSRKATVRFAKSSFTTEKHELPLDLRFETQRGYFVRLPTVELEDKILPPIFINVNKKKKYTEFSTLELVKWNKRVHYLHSLSRTSI